MKLSTNIYDLELLDVCHFHHHTFLSNHGDSSVFSPLSRYSCLHLGSLHPRIFKLKYVVHHLGFIKIYIFTKFLSVLESLNTPVSTFNWNHKSNYLKVDKYLLGIVSVLLSTLNKDLSLKCPNYRTPAEKIEQSYFKPWNLIPIIEATASSWGPLPCAIKMSFMR